MDNLTKRCNNCGAICALSDEICPKCSYCFGDEFDNSAPLIGKIDNKRTRAFIDYKADYYMKKFAKVRGKKFFLQKNFASIFFGTLWMCYRKMYKQAAIHVAISLLVMTLLLIFVPMFFTAEIDTYNDAFSQLQEYVESGGQTYYYGSYGMPVINYTYSRLLSNFSNALSALLTPVWIIVGLSLVAEIFLRLCGNAFYKWHIKEKINSSHGGTSVGSAFGAYFIIAIVNSAHLWILSFFIPFAALIQTWSTMASLA